MDEHIITEKMIYSFEEQLRADELAEGTIAKYLRDVRSLMKWAANKIINKEAVAAWKKYLMGRDYAPITINSMLAAANCFFKCMGWQECHAKFLKIQRQIFRNMDRELQQHEYKRLVATARKEGRERLLLLMETICCTGVRVSEVKYITVQAAQMGMVDIRLKGKIRRIMLPEKICRMLLKYAKKNGISAGEIFRTRSGRGISRRQIWAEMKSLCYRAGVAASKVFPHNLRHLFATVFYKKNQDIVQLADLLGHSSIETTRIYLVTSGKEHQDKLNRLGLII